MNSLETKTVYKLEPLGQRVIVKRVAKEEKNGLIMPDTSKKTGLIGQVLHCGPDAAWVEEGDFVLYGKHSGWEFPVDRDFITDQYKDCLVMNCEDILSKVVAPTEGTNAESAN